MFVSLRGECRIWSTESVTEEIDIFTTSNGSINIIMLKHMKMLRNNAIVGNIVHFDHETDMITFESTQGVKCRNVESVRV